MSLVDSIEGLISLMQALYCKLHIKCMCFRAFTKKISPTNRPYPPPPRYKECSEPTCKISRFLRAKTRHSLDQATLTHIQRNTQKCLWKRVRGFKKEASLSLSFSFSFFLSRFHPLWSDRRYFCKFRKFFHVRLWKNKKSSKFICLPHCE